MKLFPWGKKEEKKRDSEKREVSVVAKPSAKPAVKEKSAPRTQSVRGASETVQNVLRNPRITEKATADIERGVYVFDVSPDANKRQIHEAIRYVYKVSPIKVHIVNTPAKQVRSMRTGARGMKSGGKKAYVYLKKGESISIV
ncbi:MAG: 50S ribosomal protein L23 [bacterium]|nr:50S ribosomal protein L23 [bacterium]